MQVLPIKRRSSCDIRARYCDGLCAVMVRQFLFQLCAGFGSVFRQLRETVRARVAQAGAATRAGCAHSSGSVWAMNVHGYRSSGAALCCGLIQRHRWGHPLPIVVTYALVVAVPCARNGAGRLARYHSFESQTVWSALHRRVYSAARGCASNARGCRFRLRRECAADVRTFKLRLVLVATEVIASWRRTGDGLALGTLALLAMERRTIHSGLSVGREESR